MEKEGRTKKSIKNIAYELSYQIIVLVLGFVSRAVFLHVLNEAYLGINSLFTEVISVLSMADLGLASIMLFSFFEPLAKNNKEKLSSLVHFYKTLYNRIAVVVAAFGLLIVPFLKYIVNLEQNIEHMYLFYFIFLLKTVLSYLFVYKVTILYADQQNYLVSKITMIVHCVCKAVQILLLIITRNYFVYLCVDIICTFATNFICAKIVDRRYPYINDSKVANISESEKRYIFKNIKDGFIYKLSGVLLISTDNTLISVLIGTIAVAKYGNYSMITSKIANFSAVIFSSLTGSLGNLIVMESKKKRAQVFMVMQEGSNFISGIVITCIFVLINDLVRVWIGEKYILGNEVIIALLMNVYFSITLMPMWAFRDATALFRETKYIMLICAGVNLVLSLILGKWIGLAGIVAASAIARLTTYVWYEPLVLFRRYFDIGVSKLYFMHFTNALGILLVSTALHHLFSAIIVHSWLQMIGKTGLVACVTLLVYLLIHCLRKDFRNACAYLRESVCILK